MRRLTVLEAYLLANAGGSGPPRMLSPLESECAAGLVSRGLFWPQLREDLGGVLAVITPRGRLALRLYEATRNL